MYQCISSCQGKRSTTFGTLRTNVVRLALASRLLQSRGLKASVTAQHYVKPFSMADVIVLA